MPVAIVCSGEGYCHAGCVFKVTSECERLGWSTNENVEANG